MSPFTYEIRFDGAFLNRGFWIYIWEVRTPEGKDLYYVGRTGDSSSVNAQSPLNRMSQHLGALKNSNMLRKCLVREGVRPERCEFRLVAHGPIFREDKTKELHHKRRDIVAGVEKALAEKMKEKGYKVMNVVQSRKPVDGKIFEQVLAVMAGHFPNLRT